MPAPPASTPKASSAGAWITAVSAVVLAASIAFLVFSVVVYYKRKAKKKDAPASA